MDFLLDYQKEFPIVCISVISTFGLCILFSTLHKLFRLYFIVNANCWFCNKNTKVTYAQRNSFICKHCDQYNGFNEDGDYNCELSDRFKETNKSYVYQRNPKQTQKPSLFNHSFKNSLCEICNFNQALKVRSLADYSDGSRGDEEIESFRNRLDEMYRLCKDCEVKLHQVLGIQDSWLKPKLLGWKIHKSKFMKHLPLRNGQKMLSGFYKALVCICGAYLVASRVISCLIHNFPFLTENPDGPQGIPEILVQMDVSVASAGLLLVLFHFFKNINNPQIRGAQLVFSWFILTACLAYNLQKEDYQSVGLVKYGLLLGAIVNFFTVALLSRRKSIRVRTNKVESSTSPSSISSYSSLKTSNVESPSASRDLSDCFELPGQGCSASVASTTGTQSSLLKEVNDLFVEDVGLKGLKIGTPKKGNPSTATSVFSVSSLGAAKRKIDRDNIIQPAKFCDSITQSSWVAGGVWGGSPRKASPHKRDFRDNSQERELLSRSSSKSSGFISQPSDGNDNQPSWIPLDLSSNQSPSLSQRYVPRVQPRYRPLDAQSACSYQSFYTSSPAPSEREWSSFNSLHSPHFSSLNTTQLSALDTTMKSSFNWCTVFVSFFLGFSLAGNIFLYIIYLKTTA